MPNQRTPTRSTAPSTAVWLLALAATPAAAVSLAAQLAPVTLGAALDLQVGVQLEAGETLDPQCVQAEVTLGERRLPRSAVRTRLSGLRPGADGPQQVLLRVQTTARVEEPVVELVVHAGCPPRLSRRYVLFADPPRIDPAPAVSAAAAASPPAAAAARAGASASATAEATVALAGATATSTAPPAGVDGMQGRAAPAAGRASPPAAASRPAPDAAAGMAQRPASVAPVPLPARPRPGRAEEPAPRATAAETPARPAGGPAASAAARPSAARAAAAPAGPAAAAPRRSDPAAQGAAPARREARPRLRLDAPESVVPPAPALPMPATLSPQTLALVEQANSAVMAAIDELRATQQRMAALEQRVQALDAETVARRAQSDEWRQLAAQAETRQRWTMVLLAAVVLLLALAGWLWWRVRALEHAGRKDWLHMAREAAAAPDAQAPQAPGPALPVLAPADEPPSLVGAGLAPAHRSAPSQWPQVDSEPAAHLDESAPIAPSRSGSPAALPPRPVEPAPTSALAAHAVSTEELIDLEQQAEFFIVLGQDEAAVDLLMVHLRDSAGASPLPYLKLMEIYRRLGDEAAYRRTQERFNQRFNARAPDWGAREHTGRGLESYPAVVAGLQRVWAEPIDAMAELEALLFRRGGGQVFDLEAYRDLLFLYGIAREAHESRARDAGATGMVDVLLPLDTAPAELDGPARAARRAASTQPMTLDVDLGGDPVPGEAPRS